MPPLSYGIRAFVAYPTRLDTLKLDTELLVGIIICSVSGKKISPLIEILLAGTLLKIQ